MLNSLSWAFKAYLQRIFIIYLVGTSINSTSIWIGKWSLPLSSESVTVLFTLFTFSGLKEEIKKSTWLWRSLRDLFCCLVVYPVLYRKSCLCSKKFFSLLVAALSKFTFGSKLRLKSPYMMIWLILASESTPSMISFCS